MITPTHPIVKQAKFLELTENEQKLFEAYRESQLIMFPKWNGEFDQETLNMTEDAAFKFVELYPEELKEPPVLATTTDPSTTTPA